MGNYGAAECSTTTFSVSQIDLHVRSIEDIEQLHYPNRDVILIRVPNHALTARESERAYERADEVAVEPWHKSWNFTGDGSGPYQVLRISILGH